ncbi:hypothetical protein KP79_PYT20744 [Mizuhopecten yessoensis]|uniref:Uncharacterized protein n=1 Tax=Mizuhopecten yessoensis TaxID=6573 RepID=A0A210PRY6_MIZYE|nr:hypothetical protein KP79_PYT20744 [Mizuhopecten yessoensis]
MEFCEDIRTLVGFYTRDVIKSRSFKQHHIHLANIDKSSTVCRTLTITYLLYRKVRRDVTEFRHISKEINMVDQMKLILDTVTESQAEGVRAYFEENGFVQTILHLVNTVWDKETLEKSKIAIETRDKDSPLFELLFIEFNIQKHFEITDSHKFWVEKSFQRLRKFVPNMTENDAKVHDLSKYDFVQAVGYTAKWVHNLEWGNPIWQAALNDHYKRESHHPQFFNNERMTRKDLEESLVDMVACRWERDLKGDEEAKSFDLVNFDAKFLQRYVKEDFDDVSALIKNIQSENE